MRIKIEKNTDLQKALDAINKEFNTKGVVVNKDVTIELETSADSVYVINNEGVTNIYEDIVAEMEARSERYFLKKAQATIYTEWLRLGENKRKYVEYSEQYDNAIKKGYGNAAKYKSLLESCKKEIDDLPLSLIGEAWRKIIMQGAHVKTERMYSVSGHIMAFKGYVYLWDTDTYGMVSIGHNKILPVNNEEDAVNAEAYFLVKTGLYKELIGDDGINLIEDEMKAIDTFFSGEKFNNKIFGLCRESDIGENPKSE